MTDQSRQLDETEYLSRVERLAKKIVAAAIDEASFEVFLDEGAKTDLQAAITEMAQSLRYHHSEDDGCLESSPPKP